MTPTRTASSRRTAIVAPSTLLLALLGGCGGGGGGDAASPPPVITPTGCGSCAPGTLSGVAATGAPLAGATVTVIDSKGERRSGTVGAAGAFSVSVTGMTAPYVVEVTGSAGGVAIQYHAPALAGDVGTNPVNVTPLTELMTALAIGGVPAQVLSDTPDLAGITTTAVAGAQDIVRALVLPVLQAAGASASADLRTSAFSADGTGLDLALEGIQVALADGSYTVSTTLGGAAASISPSHPAAAAPLAVPANATAQLGAGSSASTALQAVMTALSAKFAGASLPTASALSPFLASDFLHDGQAAAAYIQNVLLQNGTLAQPAWNLIGARFDQVQIVQLVDASNVKFRFRISTGQAQRPWSESMYATLVNGQWLLRGDQQQFGASVLAYSKLVETPATEREMKALGAVLNTSNAASPFYTLPLTDTGDGVTSAWLGYPGVDDSFGRVGWVGDSEYAPASRLLRANHPLYFAHPDSSIETSLAFSISNNRVAGRIASVTVSGAGLPPQGLQLQPSPAAAPRDYWTFPGPDNYVVNQFSDYACQALNRGQQRIPNCRLDWGQLQAGSVYTFVATDAAGTVVDTVKATLPVLPYQSSSQMLAHRDSLFARIAPEVSRQFTLSNYYDDKNGPFRKGEVVPVSWTMPTGTGAQLNGVYFFQQWADASGAEHSSTQDEPLYGKQPVPGSLSFTVTADLPVSWVGTGVTVYDAFGNLYEHRVDADNHQ